MTARKRSAASGMWLLMLATLVVVRPAIEAQTSLATLQVKVSDAQGQSVPGATVTVREVATNVSRTGVTDDRGQYVMPNLPAGRYDVAVEEAGFAKAEQSNIVLQVGQERAVNVVLQVAAVQENVQVTAQAIQIETEHVVGALLDTKEVDSLPTFNRSFTDLALLAPGVSQMDTSSMGFSASGQHQFNDNVIVDGASNATHFYGVMADTYPQDWVQEFQVMTDSYSAEFGGASGAVVNVITKSGTNQFHGRGYGFFQNASLNAPPYAGHYTNGAPAFLPSSPPYNQHRIGAYLGGPIVKDKLFFFGGYEDLDNNATLALGITQYWINQGVQSVIPTTLSFRPFVAKADWNPNAKNRLSMRYDRTNEHYGNCAGQIGQGCNSSPTYTLESRGTFSGPVWSTSADWTNTLSNRAFNELRVYYNVNEVSIASNLAGVGGITLLQQTSNLGLYSEKTYPGAHFGTAATGGLEGETNFDVIDNFSYLKGAHVFKVGASIERAEMVMNIDASQHGRWTFNQDLAFNINNPASYPNSYNLAIGTATDTEAHPVIGVYGMDNWHVRHNLTLNLGVRYDVDYTTTSGNQFVDAYNQRFVSFLGGTPPLQKTNPDLNNFAPRVGFVWVPAKDERTTIRGGYGWFYDRNHYNYNDQYINQTLLANRKYILSSTVTTQNPFYNPANPAASAALLRAFLASNFPNPPDFSLIHLPAQQVNTLSPNLQIPYTQQVTGGFTHQFGPSIYLQADYVYAHGNDQPIALNTNLTPVNGNILNLVNIDPRYASYTIVQSIGWTQYNGLQTRLQYRGSKRLQWDVSYTVAKTTSDTLTTQPGSSAATNPFNIGFDEGPANEDRRHNLSTDAVYSLPYQFQIAAIATYASPLPYSATNANVINQRPPGYPRNSLRGDSNKNVDLRVGKTFKLGDRMSATAFWEVFNLFNTDNFTSFTGNMLSSSFKLPTAEFPKRQMQGGFRVDF